MAHIDCTVTNCYYNKNHGCSASSIEVDGRSAERSRLTSCGTFIEQRPGIRSSVSEPKSDTYIKCDAVKCIYNRSERCNAEGILVNGHNAEVPEETCCNTFKS
ncbi:MAG: DUF1540 domain-containing protein [Sedimentibacter sp.]|uniref:DUF1540 domain-containing protein n=1 Tax=Sedimentibacter sp. TaxID=1960295 RepID=UPI003158EE29